MSQQHSNLYRRIEDLEDRVDSMKRMYEDLFYNLDTDNFSEGFTKTWNGIKTSVLLTEQGLSTKVSKEEMESAINQTAEAISLQVSALSDDVSVLRISADEIFGMVCVNVSAEFSSASHPNTIDTSDAQKEMLCNFNGTYYYYDSVEHIWKIYPAGGLSTCFEQNGEKFRLKGNVEIDGSALVSGSVYASRLYGTDNTNYYAKVQSEYGDFGLFYKDAQSFATAKNGMCVWGVYQSDFVTGIVDFYVYGNKYFTYYHSREAAYPQGFWNFSECSGIEWGDNSPTAVFA